MFFINNKSENLLRSGAHPSRGKCQYIQTELQIVTGQIFFGRVEVSNKRNACIDTKEN